MLILNEKHGELYRKALEERKENASKDLYGVTYQLFYGYYVSIGLDHREAHFMASCHASSVDLNQAGVDSGVMRDAKEMMDTTNIKKYKNEEFIRQLYKDFELSPLHSDGIIYLFTQHLIHRCGIDSIEVSKVLTKIWLEMRERLPEPSQQSPTPD